MKEKKKQSAAVVVATVLTVTSVMSPVASVYADETDTAISQHTETVQIKENAPPITLPQKLVGNEGQALQDIILPENWKWSDETTVISKDGTEYPARLHVDDVTYNYSNVEGYSPEGHYVEQMVEITVELAKSEPAELVQEKSNRSLGNTPTTINAGDITINDTNFPDDTFREWIKANVQGAEDEILTLDEIKNIKNIDLSQFTDRVKIESLQGIEHFTELVSLNVYGHSSTATSLKSLDVSNNIKLETLQCAANTNLTTLKVKGANALKHLVCPDTSITALDVSENKALIYLSCQYTKIKELDVSKNTALTNLYCYSNNVLTTLNINGATALKVLDCKETRISALDVGENTSLEILNCISTGITTLDVSKNIALGKLFCSNTGLTSLDISKNTALFNLSCENTPLAWLNIGTNPNLALRPTIDLPTPAISTNIIADSFNIKDVVNDIDIQKIKITNGNGVLNKMSGDISNYDRNQPIQYEYDCGTAENGQAIKLTVNLELAIDINEANFPDSNFRQYVSDNFDTSNPKDGKLTASEIKQITKISIGNRTDITSLKGIEHFTALKALYCNSTEITSLDVSNNKALTDLLCYGTKIKSLNVKKNTELTRLWCDRTEIENLDVSKNAKLTELRCFGTKIQSLDVSSNTKLTKLYCYNNASLKNLKVDGAVELIALSCHNTEITSLNVSKNTKLITLYCYDNALAYLNIGVNNNLTIDKDNLKLVSLEITEDSFNMADKFIGIELANVTNVSGADYKNGIMSNYDVGTPITYKYDCGSSYNGNETIDVILNLTDIRKDSTISITENLSKTYNKTAVNGTPNFNKTGSNGAVSYKWEKKVSDTQWDVITYIPKDAGTYRVTATLESDSNYKGATSAPVEFTISQAESTIVISANLDKPYDGTAVSTYPSITKTGSTSEVSYKWERKISDTQWDVITYIPTDAGTYRVTATLASDSNYKGATSAPKEFTISQATNSWINNLAITGWTFGEQSNDPTAKAKFGDKINYLYSDSEKGIYTDKVPTTAGTWYVKATVIETDNYTGMESIKKFEIAKANDTWVEEPAILDWVFGETANIPIAKAKSGETVIFTYSSSEKGIYTDKVPTTAGIWYMKATVADSNNYKGLESIISFTIAPKSADNNSQIIIPDINSDKDVENLVIKDGDKELEKGTDYDVDKKQNGNEVIVTITFKGNYTGTITKTYTVNIDIPKETGSIPTGDNNQTGLLSTISLLSAVWIAFLTGKKRKKSITNN